jgi:hypothetical protein
MTAWLEGEPDDEQAHELRGLRVDEISLCDAAANRRRFLVLKAQNRGEKGGAMPQHLTESETAELESALNSPHPAEERVLAQVAKQAGGSLSAAAVNAVRAAIRLLGRYESEIGPDLIAGLAALAGEQAAAPAKATGTELTGKAASGLAAIAKAAPGRKAELVKARQDEIEQDADAYEEHRAAVIAGYPADRGQQHEVVKADSAVAEVGRRAQALIRKSDRKLSVGDAGLEVLNSDGELAARYRAETRSR